MSKKKKIPLGIAIVFFGLFVTYKTLGFKGYLSLYKVPTTASSPTLEPGDYIWTSNLAPLKRNDFVIFLHHDKKFGEGHWLYRMIAKEKDTLTIIKEVTYVNGINIDESIRVKHSYIINDNQLKDIPHTSSSDNKEYYKIGEKKILIHLEDHIAKRLTPEATLAYNIASKKENGNKVNKMFPDHWGMYNFGPLIIPEDKFFVMGDNRDNAMDSRFIGLIDQNNYIGKAINVN